MKILRLIWRVVLYGFAGAGLFAVLGVVGLGVFLLQLRDAPTEAPERIVLLLDLEAGVAERRGGGVLAGIHGAQALELRDVLRALEAARDDERVLGAVIRMGPGGLALTHAQALRRAIRRFNGAGKFSYAHGAGFGAGGNGTIPYYLATAAEQVWMQPSDILAVIGLAIEAPFIAGALDELNIEARYDQRHEFKSAGEMFTRQGFSDPARQTMSGLVEGWMTQIVEAVAKARNMDEAAVRRLIDHAPLMGAQAKAAGLVDGLGYWDEFRAMVDKRAKGSWLSVGKYLAIAPVPENGGPQVALIHGFGSIVPGADRRGPFERTHRFGADEVARTIRLAAANDDIKAIVLRIDSPGGAYVASDTVWRAIRQARDKGKPVIASLGRVAASGGYFVAMAADKIVAEPATITGSIGVFAVKFVTRDFWRRFGITWDRVQSGKRAGMWSVIDDYPAGARKKLNEILDAIYSDFTGKVAEARGLTKAAVDKVARGRVWTGRTAKAEGLVDALGGLDVAVGLVREALGLKPDDAVTLVDLPKPTRLEQIVTELRKQGFDAGAIFPSLFPTAVLDPFLARLDTLVPPVGVLQMPPIRIAD